MPTASDLDISNIVTNRYDAEPTPARFHADEESWVRGLSGPIGSGKTVASCIDVMGHALTQTADRFGRRRSRWGIFRNTYNELLTTTMETWKEWFPEEICPIRYSVPIIANLHPYLLPDGTTVYLRLYFIAIDRPEHARKIKSLELTGGFINEAREFNFSVVKDIRGRIGRWPPERDFEPELLESLADEEVPYWTGLIMDTNQPPVGHWWYNKFEKEKPEGWTLYRQPGALIRCEDGSYVINPKAENVKHLPMHYQYYLRQLSGSDKEWINVYILAKYGNIFHGRPVYQDHYNDDWHLSKEPLKVYKGLPLYLGWDYGLTPACIFGQVSPKGQRRILHEECFEKGGVKQFAQQVVIPLLANKFPGMRVISVGDPAGGQKAQTDEVTCFDVLTNLGIPTDAAPTNDISMRRDAVIDCLNLAIDGEPGLIIDPSCHMVREGFMGGYKFNRVQSLSGDTKFQEKPDKNEYSHIHDGLQYWCLKVKEPVTVESTKRRGKSFPQRKTWRAFR